MKEETKITQSKPKGFFKSVMDKLDQKLKEKASHESCCAPKHKDEKSDKSSCCS